MPENSEKKTLEKILEELVINIQGGALTIYSKEMISDYISEIKSLIPEKKEGYSQEESENAYNAGYSQAIDLLHERMGIK